MVIGTAVIELFLPEAQSLKDKRSILQSVVKRVQRKFNVSIAEIADQDFWQKACLGLAVVGVSAVHVDQQVQRILQFIESEPRLEVSSVVREQL